MIRAASDRILNLNIKQFSIFWRNYGVNYGEIGEIMG